MTVIAMNPVLDPSDVPAVAARELALALKLLTNGLALPREPLTEDQIRAAEAAYWQISQRHRARKSAVLLRLRSLIAAGQTRRIDAVLSGNGNAIGPMLAAAASLRLNAKWGFNPMKLARAAAEAMGAERHADAALAA